MIHHHLTLRQLIRARVTESADKILACRNRNDIAGRWHKELPPSGFACSFGSIRISMSLTRVEHIIMVNQYKSFLVFADIPIIIGKLCLLRLIVHFRQNQCGTITTDQITYHRLPVCGIKIKSTIFTLGIGLTVNLISFWQDDAFNSLTIIKGSRLDDKRMVFWGLHSHRLQIATFRESRFLNLCNGNRDCQFLYTWFSKGTCRNHYDVRRPLNCLKRSETLESPVSNNVGEATYIYFFHRLNPWVCYIIVVSKFARPFIISCTISAGHVKDNLCNCFRWNGYILGIINIVDPIFHVILGHSLCAI